MKKLIITDITKCDNCSIAPHLSKFFAAMKTDYKDEAVLDSPKIDYKKLEAFGKIHMVDTPFTLEVRYKLPNDQKICRVLEDQIKTRVYCNLKKILAIFIYGDDAVRDELEEKIKEKTGKQQ